MRIVVHIDRLVLDGVGQPDLPRLQAALEQALAQALTQRAPPGQGAKASSDALAPIDVSRGPEAIGQAIARAAHARIVAARASLPAAALPRPAATPSGTLSAEAPP
jgi:hypothetical protein